MAPKKGKRNEMRKVLELEPGREQERNRKEGHAEVLMEEEQQEAY